MPDFRNPNSESPGRVIRLSKHRSTASRTGVLCTSFRPVRRGKSLVGFADIYLPRWRLHLYGCGVHQVGTRRWVNLPARPVPDAGAEGQVARYEPTVGFEGRGVQQGFSDVAVRVVAEFALDAFASEEVEG